MIILDAMRNSTQGHAPEKERSVALERQVRTLAPAPNSYFIAADGVLSGSLITSRSGSLEIDYGGMR